MAINIKQIFCDPPKLYTDRLTLRRLERGDYNDMFEYARDSEVTRYLTWDPHPDRMYTMRYLSFIQSKYAAGEFFDWAVICGKKMIGTCGFTALCEQNNYGEIGYVISPLYQNYGIATEAVSRVIKFGFEVLELNRIEARFMVENDASRRVMEKAGMSFEGVLRDAMYIKNKYVSVGVCSILRSEYENGL